MSKSRKDGWERASRMEDYLIDELSESPIDLIKREPAHCAASRDVLIKRNGVWCFPDGRRADGGNFASAPNTDMDFGQYWSAKMQSGEVILRRKR